MHFVQRSPRCSEDGGICSGEEDTCADCQGTQSVSGTIFLGGLDMVITHSSLNSGHKALKVVVVALNNNNNNEYLECLTCTGPKHLHILYKYIFVKIQCIQHECMHTRMQTHRLAHARKHTDSHTHACAHTHTHTSRISIRRYVC